jgi:hypothetical protein
MKMLIVKTIAQAVLKYGKNKVSEIIKQLFSDSTSDTSTTPIDSTIKTETSEQSETAKPTEPVKTEVADNIQDQTENKRERVNGKEKERFPNRR